MNTKKLLAPVAIIFLFIFGMLCYKAQYRPISQSDSTKIPEITIANNSKIALFSPHNDDEILSAGGLIQSAIFNQSQVYVIFITNGDGHYLSTALDNNKIIPNSEDYIQSGYLRQKESKNALHELGINEQNIFFLGYPDGGIDDLLNKYWQKTYKSPYTKQSSPPYNNSYSTNSNYTGQNLENDLKSVLNKIKPDYVLLPSPDDTHKDHRACSKIIDKALRSWNSPTQEYYYLIHYPNFPSPKAYKPDNVLMPPKKIFSDKWYTHRLDIKSKENKMIALEKYQSQLSSPMLKNLMLSFIRQNELFIKAN